MAERAKKPNDSDLNRELHRYSNKAFELAKAVVDGSTTEAAKDAARELAGQLPTMVAKARDLAEAYRADSAMLLSETRLDLAFAAAGGGIPSSIRIGWYIKEKGEAPDH